jgi:thiamine biosynthesis lipoprotein
MGVAELHGRVMGSRLHVIAVARADATGPDTPARLDAALLGTAAHLEHLERCWSRFVESSDVSHLNRLGPTGGTIEVDPSTLVLLTAMVDGHQATAGRFDPTVLRASIAAGDAASRTDPARVTRVPAAPLRPGSLFDLALDPVANTVTVPPGLVVDAGGIGKGLAADLAVARLVGGELVDGAMVEIGGDLALAGSPADPSGWLVEVEHPDPNDGVMCLLSVSGGGVATSSTRSRRWTVDGAERHHQIDPLTATCSTTDLAAVTVFAPCAWLAEVHATAALAAGTDGVIAYLDGHGLSGLAVAGAPAGGRVLATADLVDLVDPVDLVDANRCGVS